MQFAIIGKNKALSLKELGLIGLKDYEFVTKNTIIFKGSFDKIDQLGGIVKYGDVMDFGEFIDNCETFKLLGTNSKYFGNYLKEKSLIRRYKIVDEVLSDLEIKRKGKEILCFDKKIDSNSKLFVVRGYQNIDFFELVDFGKISSGMNIGMMPAKLTQILINVGVGIMSQKSIRSKVKSDKITIYDPFVGFGTTGFVANYLGYDFVGSDINITQCKQNYIWWQKQKYFNEDCRFTIYKHDILDYFKKKFLDNVDLIVTEGWLGPVVGKRTQKDALLNNIKQIKQIYGSFLGSVFSYRKSISAVFTIPVYIDCENYIMEYLVEFCKLENIELEFIDEIYRRKGQTIGRQVVIVKK